ncbi:hypothetical protein E4L95_01715 [Paracoccus liaowanqingii]|uniref:Uncharacterized protein n=1 Tax=Paracoccus liaowanqingii TaxID=2560053 RepID=A0A4Z1CSH9_9RHOB|nr:hypothetical protein [Paracoccus liaowanqingii]TGN68320.1 hypothetical protein E4L95_01715 [Paracoccus liaowanqingii]
MFDRNSALAGAATVILGTIIGGAGVLYYAGSPSRAEPSSLTQTERDSMLAATDGMSETQMAENQMEPPVSQADRNFLDFTTPDLAEAAPGQNLTRHGCVKPEEPTWATNAPPEDAQQVLLLKALYDNSRYENIVQTSSCPCEVEYPSWDEADASYQALVASRGLDEIPVMRDEVSRLVRRNLKASIDICKVWRGR